MVDVVQVNYENGWFTVDDVALMVPVYITKEDYKTITGQDYDEGIAPESVTPVTSASESAATSQAI